MEVVHRKRTYRCFISMSVEVVRTRGIGQGNRDQAWKALEDFCSFDRDALSFLLYMTRSQMICLYKSYLNTASEGVCKNQVIFAPTYHQRTTARTPSFPRKHPRNGISSAPKMHLLMFAYRRFSLMHIKTSRRCARCISTSVFPSSARL
jgi:hypothetical protein